jgi:hypothetical protein
LRDIYVFGTSMEDWESVWKLLAGGRDRLTFSVDGVVSEPPTTAADVFAIAGKHSVLAAYAGGGFTINCHFFTPAEIEFDIDPREMGGRDAGEAIVRFIAAIGEATRKPVVLTEENDRSTVIACFDPKTGVIG